MGSLSIWHWIFVVAFAAVSLLVVGGLGLLALHLARRRPAPRPYPAAPPPRAPAESVEHRLEKLQALLAQGHLSREEYERQRKRIIAEV